MPACVYVHAYKVEFYCKCVFNFAMLWFVLRMYVRKRFKDMFTFTVILLL